MGEGHSIAVYYMCVYHDTTYCGVMLSYDPTRVVRAKLSVHSLYVQAVDASAVHLAALGQLPK